MADDPSFHEIIPNKLYLGPGRVATQNPQALEDLGITHIVNACQLKCEYPEKFYYKHLKKLEDNYDATIAEYIPEVHAFIDKALSENGKVYCHCREGKSRSASLVISYLMKTKDLTYDQALAYLKKKRPIVQPNVGFEMDLRKYEEKLHPRSPSRGNSPRRSSRSRTMRGGRRSSRRKSPKKSPRKSPKRKVRKSPKRRY